MTYSDPGDQTGRVVDSTDPKQQGLFEEAPYQGHSETSRAAAQAIQGERAATIRERVYAYISAHGPVTDGEIQLGMDIPGSTQRPRRIRLVELGRVRPDGARRAPSGRMATTWTAV